MPPAARPRHDPTDDWIQIRLLVASPEQETYELLRPIVLFGQPPATRARETGVPERTLRRKAARFDAHGMRSLFELDPPPATDRRRLPPEVRRAILELKAEYPAFGLREIARICRERFDRPVGHHAVERVLAQRIAADPAAAAVPPLPRDRRSHRAAAGGGDAVPRRLERQGDRRLPGDLPAHGLRRAAALGRGGAGPDWPTARGPHTSRRARSTSGRWSPIRRLQANPELGRVPDPRGAAPAGHATSRPRTCGRILALHRDLGAPLPSRGGAARAAADAVCRPATPPVLVGRYPLRRRPRPGNWQTRARLATTWWLFREVDDAVEW